MTGFGEKSQGTAVSLWVESGEIGGHVLLGQGLFVEGSLESRLRVTPVIAYLCQDGGLLIPGTVVESL